MDPISREYPFYSPYAFAGNMPIKFIDLDGLEPAQYKITGLGSVLNGTTQDGFRPLPKIQTQEINKIKASQPVVVATVRNDPRSDYQRKQGAAAMKNREFQNNELARRALDPFGYDMGKNPVMQQVAVGLLTNGAANIIMAEATPILNYGVQSALGAAGDAGQAYVLADFDTKKIDKFDIMTNILPGHSLGFGRDVIKNLLDASFDVTSENGTQSVFLKGDQQISIGKSAVTFGLGLSKDFFKSQLAARYGNMDVVGQRAGALVTRSFDAASDATANEFIKKYFPEIPKK